jgi:hypothetical protein
LASHIKADGAIIYDKGGLPRAFVVRTWCGSAFLPKLAAVGGWQGSD